MEGTNNQTGGERRLVLGFDAGCMTCRRLARSIEEAVGDRLEVRDLRDPTVARWIERALGQEAQWVPTLVEVSGDRVRAWTGLRLGPALSRRLGVRNTWRVIKALGANEEPEMASAPTDHGFNRTQILKGLGGAALAMSVLSGTDVFVRIANATEWVHPLNRKKVISSKQLEGEVLQEAVARAAVRRDVKTSSFPIRKTKRLVPGCALVSSTATFPKSDPSARDTYSGAASCRSCLWKRSQDTTLTWRSRGNASAWSGRK